MDVVAGGIRFLVRGGVAGTGGVAPGGRWGMRVERSVAAIRFAGAVRARGVVARSGRVVGSGSGGGGVVVVVVGPLVVVALVVVGLVLRVWPLDPLWVFRSPLWGWGVGHHAQPLGVHYVVGREGGSGAGLDGDGS